MTNNKNKQLETYIKYIISLYKKYRQRAQAVKGTESNDVQPAAPLGR